MLSINYQTKDGKQTKTYDALEWLAAMCTHIPGRGEQMVRYYAPSLQNPTIHIPY
jgi:hypothetical protein